MQDIPKALSLPRFSSPRTLSCQETVSHPGGYNLRGPSSPLSRGDRGAAFCMPYQPAPRVPGLWSQPHSKFTKHKDSNSSLYLLVGLGWPVLWHWCHPVLSPGPASDLSRSECPRDVPSIA